MVRISGSIILPPTLAEQTAIATALNDADALITQLEKLIAKKRAIKQGAMQKCLNPDLYDLQDDADLGDGTKSGKSQNQKNHNSDKWEVKKLGDLFEPKVIKPILKKDDMVVFLGMEDVSGEGKILNQNMIQHSRIKKGLTFFKKNDVLVAKITPCFENGKGACLDTLKTDYGFGSTEFHVLSANDYSIPRFIFYHTQNQKFRKHLESEMIGTAGQKRVSLKSIINYQISLPPLPDQTCIAQILADMDAEIEVLEKKLEKYKKIKQGMMQELLTGRIRLV